jgi:hypothetical protein
MMCLAVSVDVWGMVIMAVTIGVMCIMMLGVFVWYLHSRDKLFTQTIKGIEHSCHDFQREINNNTRDAFTSILQTLRDAKHALDTSGEVTVRAMTMLQRLHDERSHDPPDSRGPHI